MRIAFVLSAILLLFATPYVTAVSAEKPAVAITLGAEQLEYRTFPKGRQPPGAEEHRRGRPVAGLCRWELEYACNAEFKFPRLGFKQVTATVTHVSVTASLRIVIWTEEGSPRSVVDHEEGHRAITRHFYAQVEPVARRAAQAIVGRKLSVPARGDHATRFAAIDGLQAEILATLSREIDARCSYAQDRFDDLTYADPALPIAAAIARALKLEGEHYTRPGQRSIPP